MTTHDIEMRVNFAELALMPRRVIWRVTQLAAFALTAVDKVTDEQFGVLSLPDALIQMEPAHVPEPQTRAAFRHWVVGCALRDSVESMNSFLEEVRRTCVLSRFARCGTIPAEKWLAEGGARERFHRHGLPKKLQVLAEEFGVTQDNQNITDLLSINAARNCLVHRGGVVAEVDRNSTEGLTVTWYRLDLRIHGAHGERTVERMPEIVDEGEEIVLLAIPAKKIFPIGGNVDFTNEEFATIGFFLSEFARQVAQITERAVGLPGDGMTAG